MENQKPDLKYDAHPSTSALADLEYAADRIECIRAGEPVIVQAVLGLKAIASVALRGFDFRMAPPALVARLQSSFLPATMILVDCARPAIVPEHVTFCMAQANTIISSLDDGLDADRVELVCQLIAELTAVHHRRVLEARGNRLTKAFAIRNAAAIAVDPLSPKH